MKRLRSDRDDKRALLVSHSRRKPDGCAMVAGECKRRSALPLLLAVVLAIGLLVAGPTVLAWAEEVVGPEAIMAPSQEQTLDLGGENVLNPQQTPDSSFIYDTSIEELSSADSYMDGQTVQVRGEVVGDRINAEFDPDHCWIVLQSLAETDNSIAVFMRMSSSHSIDTYGAYGRTGTTLQVRGTFNLACIDHEGVSDLHADHISVMRKGSVWDNPFPVGTFALGLVLVVVGMVLGVVFWRLRESRR